MSGPRTLLDKVWSEHVIVPRPGSEDLLFVDLNLVHEGGTFLAFDQLRMEGRKVRKPTQTLAVTDHYLPSLNRAAGPPGISNPAIRNVVEWLDQNTREFGIEHIGMRNGPGWIAVRFQHRRDAQGAPGERAGRRRCHTRASAADRSIRSAVPQQDAMACGKNMRRR